MCDAEEGTAKAEQEIDQELIVLGRSTSEIRGCRRGTPTVEAGEGGEVETSWIRSSDSWSISCSAFASPAPQEEKATIDPVSQRRLIDNDADDLPFFTNGAPIKELGTLALEQEEIAGKDLRPS
jgi:hypothetical protein